MAWAKTALREPTYHLERARHWHHMLVAREAPINEANYHTLAYVHCGMAIDAMPPDEVTDALRTARDEIWDHHQSVMQLPELLKKLTAAVRHANQATRRATLERHSGTETLADI